VLSLAAHSDINTSSRDASTLDLNTKLKSTLTDYERNLASQWQLTDDDWVKYKQIMSGPRGTWSPGIDPLTALGVSATDESERKRYAELWIKVETSRAELEIAFEVERQAAAKRLLKGQLAINNSEWIKAWEENQERIDTRVDLYVDSNCTDECKSEFTELWGSIGDNATLDIYFKDGASSDDIGRWAAFMDIPPESVRSRTVTLNFDKGRSLETGIQYDSNINVRVLDVKSGSVTDTFKE
jgi:integrating conjugative element protein (TIGR03759 family)